MRITYFAVFALLLLSACTQQPLQATPTPTYSCPDGSIVEDIDDCEQPEQTQSAEDLRTDEEPTQPVEVTMLDLQARAQEKTSNGYSFTYSETSEGLPVNDAFSQARIYVKDEQVLIELYEQTEIQGMQTTHILMANDTATAYCESCETQPRQITAPGIALPVEWLYDFQDVSLYGTQTIEGRSSYRLLAVIDEQQYEAFVDSYSGVPLEVRAQQTTYAYSDVGLGVREGTFDV